MVGHLHLQAMEESLKGKSREGLLDSPDSGLPPSPSPPFCPLSPSTAEPRTPIGTDHHGGMYWRKEGREGKLVSRENLTSADPNRIIIKTILIIMTYVEYLKQTLP